MGEATSVPNYGGDVPKGTQGSGVVGALVRSVASMTEDVLRQQPHAAYGLTK